MAIAFTTDRGVSWQRRSLSGSSQGFTRAFAFLGNGTIIAAGNIGTAGAVYISNDSGGRWQAAPSAPAETVYSLAAQGSAVYAATPAGLYRSADRCSTWTNLGGGTGLRAVRWRGGFVFVGGDQGVSYAIDGGSHWDRLGGTLNSQITWLEFSRHGGDDALLAGTPGAGVFRWQFPDAVTEAKPRPLGPTRVTIQPNPARGRILIRAGTALAPMVGVRLWDAVGRLALDRRMHAAGRELQLDLTSLSPGVYQLELDASGRKTRSRITVVR